MTTINNIGHLVFCYIFPLVLSSIVFYSVYINYKQEILYEHIHFVNDQIPGLKTDNATLMNDIMNAKEVSKSFNIRFSIVEHKLDILLQENIKLSIEDLTYINSYMMENLNSPNLFTFEGIENLSPRYLNEISHYVKVKFLNNLLNFLYSSNPMMYYDLLR